MTVASPTRQEAGCVTFALHSHLPYVINHGTWPHGTEWLYEAAAETYLPLLAVFTELERQGLALKANVNLSPILLEQLSHPVFKAEFPKYVTRKIEAAIKDADDFGRQGEAHMAKVAHFWRQFYEVALRQFEDLGSDIVRGFRYFYDSGAIEIITCGATHGYFPLLGTDASIHAQVKTGVDTHRRFFARRPRGIWLPECGYRPAGAWQFPVPVSGPGGARSSGPVMREGVEQILAENGIEFFYVDTHLVDASTRFTPYEILAGNVPVAVEIPSPHSTKNFYHPYYADSANKGNARVAFFTRDPRTGIQVWSGEHGYPGDPNYLEFHKKRWPGGHRYWRITGNKVDLGAKQPYDPDVARARVREHAAHFAHITTEVLETYGKNGVGTPVLTAPFDAELFGHWWFEGPGWLKHVALEYAKPESQVRLVTGSEYLQANPPSAYLALPEGSWGANSDNSVWLNDDTAWTWKHIYAAELAVQEMANTGSWQGNPTATRLARQICREMLLLESSDWQFLITTKHARDYAEKRFNTHLDQLRALLDAWHRFESTRQVPADKLAELEMIELRDSVFPNIEPELWANAAVAAK
ncbi:MAG TPA: 1,4-alpha-glucan branching protein domain-containing protein [Verrucomicrobiae bacterium]|jgi:1,4-alpha-glucan branching enzyme|nr:1,4-alpha-glucan branching protein domain-containing protein [Verrucomicrobiae bacterium]